MSGQGKYTTYVPPNSAKRSFFEKLFSSSPFIGLSQADAPAEFNATANTYLVPTHQVGDLDHFPAGVDLNFQGAPNLPDDVVWTNPGDPANAYTPDIISPGPGPGGAINVSPNDVDPTISIEDIKPNYVGGVIGTDANGGTGTASPDDTSATVYKPLGTTYKLGSSQ